MTEDRNGRPPKQGTLEGAIQNTIDRPELRAQLRPADPRERARQRAAELLQNPDVFREDNDEFYIPQSIIPDGWEYEWKRWSVLNQEDPIYQTELRRHGWDYVEASRHPEMMPLGSTEKTIIRKGMVLMERPAEISDRVRDHERRKARDRVRQKEEQLNTPGPGEFERSNKDSSLVKVKKSYSPMPIPD